MNSNKPTISEVLRLLRISNDLSIKQLSEQTGISISYITELEKGVRTKPSISTIEKYSKALNVSSSTILFFQESFDNQHYTYQKMMFEMLKKISETREL